VGYALASEKQIEEIRKTVWVVHTPTEEISEVFTCKTALGAYMRELLDELAPGQEFTIEVREMTNKELSGLPKE